MKEEHNESKADHAYKDKLYKYVASLNASSTSSKGLYSKAVQCHVERNKKRDSSTYCSTCFTSNPYQWRLKLTSSKSASKNTVGKLSNRKNKELVLKCVVCHTVKKHNESSE